MDELKWYSPMQKPFELAGFAWIEKHKVYSRLPQDSGRGIPKPVEELAKNTAGGQIRFRTDSKRIAISVKLSNKADMYHMPATGQCGFDCYIETDDKYMYCSTSRFDHRLQEYQWDLLNINESKDKGVIINFPLYQGVEEVLIGLEQDAEVTPPSPYASDKKIIFYGTSIAQGGCASRSGMLYTNIIGRLLNIECVNLGFSGRGFGEPAMAELIAEIEKPGCFVLDYEANAGMGVKDTLENFINILRKAHPDVPIVVVSKTRYSAESFNPASLSTRLELLAFQRNVVDEMRAGGDKSIYFVDGSKLLGDDWSECTVDGVHPTDLGFYNMALNLAPVLKELVSETK